MGGHMPMKLSKYAGVKSIIRYGINIGKTPATFTDYDLDVHCRNLLKSGRHYCYVRVVKSNFRRFLSENHLGEKFPYITLPPHASDYGIRLADFPPLLEHHVKAVLEWKQAPYVYGRPASARHRPVTTKRLQSFICRLYGYAVNIL